VTPIALKPTLSPSVTGPNIIERSPYALSQEGAADRIAAWLHETAMRLFPDSSYAKSPLGLSGQLFSRNGARN
jgi:hypothetical protein